MANAQAITDRDGLLSPQAYRSQARNVRLFSCSEMKYQPRYEIPVSRSSGCQVKSTIEAEYQKRIDAMTPAQRVARSAAMFQWTREQLARQIIAQLGPMDASVLKWHIALRLYGNEPIVREMIERELAHVSS